MIHIEETKDGQFKLKVISKRVQFSTIEVIAKDSKEVHVAFEHTLQVSHNHRKCPLCRRLRKMKLA